MLAQLLSYRLAPSLKSVLLLALCWLLVLPLAAQTSSPPAGRVVVKTLDSKLLRGNPGGENPRRRVSVYLPADYETHPQRRYPVVYYLHGFTWNDSLIFKQDGMKTLLDQAIADRQIRPFILVVPNEQTRFGGSWYVNSATNGPWADFTARELIEFVDKNFRTLARPGSRGLAGHSGHAISWYLGSGLRLEPRLPGGPPQLPAGPGRARRPASQRPRRRTGQPRSLRHGIPFPGLLGGS
jgi:hypothetical protein